MNGHRQHAAPMTFGLLLCAGVRAALLPVTLLQLRTSASAVPLFRKARICQLTSHPPKVYRTILSDRISGESRHATQAQELAAKDAAAAAAAVERKAPTARYKPKRGGQPSRTPAERRHAMKAGASAAGGELG